MVVLEGGFEQRRTGRRKEGGPLGHYATRDGAVSIVAYMPEHWRILAEWVHEETGVEEILAEEFAGTPVTRSPYAELLDLWIEGLTTRYNKQAFFEDLDLLRIRRARPGQAPPAPRRRDRKDRRRWSSG